MLYTRRSFQLPATNKGNPAMCAEKGIHTILRGECVHCGRTKDQLDSVEESQLHRASIAMDAAPIESATAPPPTPYVELFGGPFDGVILPAGDLVPDGRTNIVTIDGVTGHYDGTSQVASGLRHFVYAGPIAA